MSEDTEMKTRRNRGIWGRTAGRSAQAAAGLAVCALGAYIGSRAQIGMSPWDALNMGVGNLMGASFGTAAMCINLFVLAADLLLGERIGIGTLFDAFLYGRFFDLWAWMDFMPKISGIWFQIPVVLAGQVITCVGQVIYMRAALCCGPRDALLVGVGKRFSRWPIGAVQIALLVLITLADLLLGSPIGIGTLILVLAWGTVLELVCRVMRFEPRAVEHESLGNTIEKLRKPSEK